MYNMIQLKETIQTLPDVFNCDEPNPENQFLT